MQDLNVCGVENPLNTRVAPQRHRALGARGCSNHRTHFGDADCRSRFSTARPSSVCRQGKDARQTRPATTPLQARTALPPDAIVRPTRNINSPQRGSYLYARTCPSIYGRSAREGKAFIRQVSCRTIPPGAALPNIKTGGLPANNS